MALCAQALLQIVGWLIALHLSLIGSFKLISFIFSRIEPERTLPPDLSIYGSIRIASLIAIKDDRPRDELIRALKKQSDVYVLDDSKEEYVNPGVKVIRYGAKSKGEAINRWVEDYGERYDFVGIFDYDSVVSEDFYAKIIPYFSAKEIAFVQAKIKSDGFLGDEVERFFQDRIKACFLSCGHSVVFRAEVLRENPLPETMGEDVLYSIDLFSKGYKSVLADVWTYDVGMGPIEFLARSIKWAGNEKLFIRKIPALLKSKIPLAKKLEIFSDLTRNITATMIIVGLTLFPLDPWTQLITIALGYLISRLKPKNALVAPGYGVFWVLLFYYFKVKSRIYDYSTGV